MQIRRSVGVGVLVALLLSVGISVALLIGYYPQMLGLHSNSEQQTIWLLIVLVTTLVCVLALVSYHLLGHQRGRADYARHQAADISAPAAVTGSGLNLDKAVTQLKTHLHQHHGFLWRRRVRLLLVIGEPEQIEAVAPRLTQLYWLAGQGVVLLWGGSPSDVLSETVGRWRSLTRGHPMAGIVWALSSEQMADSIALDVGGHHLRGLARTLNQRLPLHVWQVCNSQWPQHPLARQPIGCLLPTTLAGTALGSLLSRLQQPLRQQGLAHVEAQMNHDFLLRLSNTLARESNRSRLQARMILLDKFSRGIALRGLWFSLPAPCIKGPNNIWPQDAAWAGVLDDKVNHRRVGWPPSRIAYVSFLGLAMLWGAGLWLSTGINLGQFNQVQNALSSVQQPSDSHQQLLALHELVRELGRLDERAQRGEPWFQRFGLSQNRALLAALWPGYVEANNRLIRDPMTARLQQQLRALVALAPDSPQRAKRAHNSYVQLKAYLMMAHPEKADTDFLLKAFNHVEPGRDGVTSGVWKGLSPTLWRFYAEQLPAHPELRIEIDPTLLAQVRQVLLGQLGQRNAEAGLYKRVLETAARQYPDLRLQQMVGETEDWALFSSDASVQGVFTRQAWEGHVRQAIDDIAEARREEIDWVLSDNQRDIAAEASPDALRARLTERFFEDYSSAWLTFLNSVRWRNVNNLGEVIDQLTLMSDVRRSPLIALMNTVAWQGQAGNRSQALTDSLIESAQKLIGPDVSTVIDQHLPAATAPLHATFGPLLALLGDGAQAPGDNDRLSLQGFLNRVNRVRLKLQQVSNASDPQGMTQAMAQTVFQGKSIDLTDTQSYGGLIAASLGAEWGSVGQALFVQPLDQAWQRVLQPSAAGINRQWQQAIVDHWESAFAGRYPFAASGGDASLPMLGKMIRADSGRIEQFLQRQLSGVLRKDGGVWVADPRHSQGLRINPQFLDAVNELSHLADVLYTDGGMGMSFELQGKPVRDVVQTVFTLNGERHQYFNQKESWQRFAWPGSSDHPGASLTWTSVYSGERLYGDYQGVWGLIRWLDSAKVTPLDDSDSRYRIVVKAPDGLDLTWYLRTELSAGPMSLLKLRNFKLPNQIFFGTRAEDQPLAQNGAVE